MGVGEVDRGLVIVAERCRNPDSAFKGFMASGPLAEGGGRGESPCRGILGGRW